MTYSKSLFLELFRDIFQESPLPPDEQFVFENLLTEFFEENVILVSDKYHDLTEEIYQDKNVGKIFRIAAISFEKPDYLLFLLDEKIVDFKAVFVKTMGIHKAKFSREELSLEMKDFAPKWAEYSSMFRNLLNSSLRSVRKVKENRNSVKSDDFLFPDLKTMEIFYKCGRKIRFENKEKAENSQIESGAKSVYECSFCLGWHSGNPPTGQEIPQEIMEGRYKTIWRRMQGI